MIRLIFFLLLTQIAFAAEPKLAQPCKDIIKACTIAGYHPKTDLRLDPRTLFYGCYNPILYNQRLVTDAVVKPGVVVACRMELKASSIQSSQCPKVTEACVRAGFIETEAIEKGCFDSVLRGEPFKNVVVDAKEVMTCQLKLAKNPQVPPPAPKGETKK